MSASRNEPLGLDFKRKFNYLNGIKGCIIYSGDGSEYKRYQCLNVGVQPISSKESLTTLNYYKKGRLVLVKTFFNKSLIQIREDSFSYNDSGEIIKRIRKHYDISGGLTTTQEIVYSYKYDSVGNWISCFVTDSQISSTSNDKYKYYYSIKREIKYAQKDIDYDYLDPEYAEDIRNKQIADSIKIVEESARKEAERNERIEKTNIFFLIIC